MKQIKTIPTYRLFAKLAEAKPSVRKTFYTTIILALISLLFQLIISGDPALIIVTCVALSLFVAFLFFGQPPYYKPQKSYMGLREIAKGRVLTPMVIKYLPIVGVVGGFITDLVCAMFPAGTILLGGSFTLIAYIAKNKPEWFIEKSIKTQAKYHQNIDYNAKVDLNITFNVNDKLFLSYQNFELTQKQLENGNFILGVSPLGIYFAHKKNVTEKLFVRYEEMDSIGLLSGVGNVFIFHIKTIHNNELNIIIDATESLVVSPYKIFDKMLTSIDEFLLNGSVASATVERRRRVVTTPSSTVAATSQVESSTSGRAIEMDTTTETINESSDNTSRRVIDIEFTPEVLAELAQGSFIEANRSIDVF